MVIKKLNTFCSIFEPDKFAIIREQTYLDLGLVFGTVARFII